jgi:hypothetical protein
MQPGSSCGSRGSARAGYQGVHPRCSPPRPICPEQSHSSSDTDGREIVRNAEVAISPAACFAAFTMFSYPVQRRRLPSSSCRTSSSVMSGRPSTSLAVAIYAPRAAVDVAATIVKGVLEAGCTICDSHGHRQCCVQHRSRSSFKAAVEVANTIACRGRGWSGSLAK